MLFKDSKTCLLIFVLVDQWKSKEVEKEDKKHNLQNNRESLCFLHNHVAFSSTVNRYTKYAEI